MVHFYVQIDIESTSLKVWLSGARFSFNPVVFKEQYFVYNMYTLKNKVFEDLYSVM